MPDRIIRDELLQSGRWLDLPTDSHRLIFENLILIADDYGNLEGGPRRLFRWMHSFSQIKTEADSIKVMSDLQDADMVLRYEAENKEYWHIQRFKNSRKYWTRKWPRSPYIESNRIPTKQSDTNNPDPILTPIEPHLPGGVGVGVGELPSRTPRKPRAASVEKTETKSAEVWLAYSKAYFNRYGCEPTRNAAVNANLCRLITRVGAQDAPHVAAFYVSHNASWYVSKGHATQFLLTDAEKLRTEWITNRQITQTSAQQSDKRQANASVFNKLIEAARDEKSKP